MENRTQVSGIILIILCTIFTAGGQILWKLGLKEINFAFPLTLINLPFWLGFVSYGIGAMLMILAFRRGELSVIYPIIATSYVWVSILSPLIFPTDFMNEWKWAGVLVILFSVSILGLGNSRRRVSDG